MSAAELRFALPWIATIGLALIGVLATIAPRFLSKNYGVPIDGGPPLVYVRAAGTRDVALALLLALVLLSRISILTAIACYVVAALAFLDFVTVLAIHRYRVSLTLLTHLAGGLIFLASALLLSNAARW